MWIQLLAPKTIEISGKNQRYNPGDWVEVGKHVALLWLADNSAQIPEMADSGFDLSNSGILTDHKELLCKRLQEETKSISVLEGAPCLPFEKTILMDSALPLRTTLIPVGVALLDTWEIAVPLMDYSTLAIHLGTDTERETTKAVIRDLRVPVYDTRLMFVKRNETTERLIDNWRNAGKTPLAFLRELYRIKPFILALPCTWTSGMPLPKHD